MLGLVHQTARGIAGVRGKQWPSVVVSNGRKDPAKTVVEKDRFHLVETHENKQKFKPHHPAFAAFNSAAPEKRRVLYGILAHISEEDALWYQRKAQQLPVSFYKSLDWYKQARENQVTIAHPNRLPACCGGGGDGKARRWFGPEPDDFRIIDCPGKNCEFSKKTEKTKKPPCGPALDFMFQLMWKDDFAGLPSVIARYISHGYDTLDYFVGFFKAINESIAALGIENPVLYGFPFMISLTEKTKPSEHWVWPVVTITPLVTPLEFFHAQMQKRLELKTTAAQIPAVVTISEEMAANPAAYIMNETGPLAIGRPQNDGTGRGAAVIVEIKPEKIVETPANEGNGQALPSSEQIKSQDGAFFSETDGKNRPVELFPKDWEVVRAKVNKKIESTWGELRSQTLGEIINGKDSRQKENAIHELRFRIFKFGKLYKSVGKKDDWLGTIGYNIEEIPIEQLATIAQQLTNGWKKFSEKK